MQPVNHFEVGIEVDALDRGHERLEDFQAAHRAVMGPLPRRCQPRGPGRANATDEDQAGVLGRWQRNGDFAFADLVFSYHSILVPTFRSSCSIAPRTFTNFGKSWALADNDSSAAYDLKSRERGCGRHCRDFRSAALV